VTAEAERQKLEADLATSAATLSQLQTQLASAKVGYETENRLLEDLRKRYQSQASEIQTVRTELIRAESDLSALKLERAEIGGNLLREKDDLLELKRRVAEVGQETQSLRKEVDQAKKDARQHKGLLAIAKKQLSTAEAEKESVAKELGEARAEAEEAEKEIQQTEAALDTLRKQSSSPVTNGVGNGSIHQSPSMGNSEIRGTTETKSPEIGSPALPFTNTSAVASPALSSKSNNPFDRLRKSSVSSETSLQARSASPFAPSNLNATEKGLMSPVDDDDPFGFNQTSPTQLIDGLSHSNNAAPDTPRQNSNPVEEKTEKTMLSPTHDTLFTPTDSFFTPPSSSAGNNALDAIFGEPQEFSESKFPPLAEENSGRKNTDAELPPLQEIEKGEESSSDDDDEDNRPLGQVKAEKQSATTTQATPSGAEGTQSASFNDAFGFDTAPAEKVVPVASSEPVFDMSGLVQPTSAPVNAAGSSSTVPNNLNGISRGKLFNC
jgi:epidermal growth factor receptor substrate 15